MSEPIPVLFTHFGEEWIRGSETVLLDLLRSLDKRRVSPVVWCNGEEMASASRAAGYPTYRSEFCFFFDYGSPPLNVGHLKRLVEGCRTLCREHGIRVLHANSAAPAQWLVPAGFCARVPVLAHLHIDYLRRSRYACLLHAATVAVGVSRQVIEGLIADGMSPTRTRVIYNGIDQERLSLNGINLRVEKNIPADAFVISTAGSLIRRKGHDVLIRAFSILPTKAVAPHLLIPGDGPERLSLEALATSLGVAERVHFLGYTSDVAQVYRAADIFALASRGDAFGLVLAEAGYFGLPSVSTRVGGIPEVVEHGRTGLLVRPDDSGAFARAMTQLMDDSILRARLGSQAASRVASLFTIQRMARQFEEEYEFLATIPRSRLGWGSSIRRLRPYAKLLSLTRTRAVSRYPVRE